MFSKTKTSSNFTFDGIDWREPPLLLLRLVPYLFLEAHIEFMLNWRKVKVISLI